MRKKGNSFGLTKDEKVKTVKLVKEYLSEQFGIEAGILQTEIFIDFITENIGMYYYNKAIGDAINAMNEKVDDLYLLMKDEVYRN